jgi:hypothetical protein
MGTVRLHDASGVTRFEVSALDGVHRLDVRWPSETTARAAGASTPGSDGATASHSARASDEADRSDDVTEPGDDSGARPGLSDRSAWLLVVPLAATLVGVAVGLVFGFGVFDTGTPGDATLLPYVVLVPYFLAGLAGTLWLVEDAASLADSDADWQPNPWLYVVSGTLVLETVVAVPVLRGEITTGIVPYLAGGLVLAGVLSSVVTGPIYFIRRRRNLDTA